MNDFKNLTDDRDAWKRDAEAYKAQLKLCEEHAMTMAKDFDASVAVMRKERDALKTQLRNALKTIDELNEAAIDEIT